MRKLAISAAVAGLAALGLAVPAAPAQAAPQGARAFYCDAEWNSHGRDGNVRAWSSTDCTGTLLGVTPGNDLNWGDNEGAFQSFDLVHASSVMNSGYVGGRDVVAFYFLSGGSGSYACLSPYELYVDDLSRNTFTNNVVVEDNIGSHRWVYSSECAPGSWMS